MSIFEEEEKEKTNLQVSALSRRPPENFEKEKEKKNLQVSALSRRPPDCVPPSLVTLHVLQPLGFIITLILKDHCDDQYL